MNPDLLAAANIGLANLVLNHHLPRCRWHAGGLDGEACGVTRRAKLWRRSTAGELLRTAHREWVESALARTRCFRSWLRVSGKCDSQFESQFVLHHVHAWHNLRSALTLFPRGSESLHACIVHHFDLLDMPRALNTAACPNMTTSYLNSGCGHLQITGTT